MARIKEHQRLALLGETTIFMLGKRTIVFLLQIHRLDVAVSPRQKVLENVEGGLYPSLERYRIS